MSEHSTPPWRELEQKSSRLGRVQVLVAVVLAAGLAWVGVELTISAARRWSVDHPVTVAFAIGLILMIITVFAVERWLRYNESRQWRAPALVALDAYVFAADRVARIINDRALALAKEIPNPPRSEPRLSDMLVLLLAQPPAIGSDGPLVELGRLARDEANALAITATLTSDMLARYQPFAWVVGVIAREQWRLAAIADQLNGMGRMMAGPEYQHDPDWEPVIADNAEKVFRELTDYLETLQEMRMQVVEAQGPG